MLTSETKTIEGVEYRVTRLPTKKGLVLFEKLMDVIGEPMAAFMSSQDAERSSEEDSKTMSQAMGMFAKNIQGGKLVQFLDDFSPSTEVLIEDKWIRLNNISEFHFSGAYNQFMGWVLFCLEVNYQSFLDGFLSNLNNAPKAEKTE